MITFNILGCCVSRGPIEQLKQYRDDIAVNQYVAFINPISLCSEKGRIELAIDDLSDYNISDFRKRNLCLDVNKEAFDYLFWEKSDYIIIDLLDARHPMIRKDGHYITTDPSTITRTEKENEKFGWADYENVDTYSVPDDKWDNAIDILCSRILEHYSLEQIIVIEAYGALKAMHPRDGRLCNFTQNQVKDAMNYNLLVKKLYCRLLNNLKGCHYICFPKHRTVFGNAKDRWGIMPLHYWEPYYEYSAQAIDIITNKLMIDDERRELNRLKNRYEENFEVLRIQAQLSGIQEELREVKLQNERLTLLSIHAEPDISQLCKSFTDIDCYLDFVKKISARFLVVLAIRDTSGNALRKEIIAKIKEIGFSNFNNEVRWMYAGAIYKSLVICDELSLERCMPVNYENGQLNLKISSNSYLQGNKAQIIIGNVDYAVNIRGINMVIYDTDKKMCIDSIAYDCHFGYSSSSLNMGFVRKSFD